MLRKGGPLECGHSDAGKKTKEDEKTKKKIKKRKRKKKKKKKAEKKKGEKKKRKKKKKQKNAEKRSKAACGRTETAFVGTWLIATRIPGPDRKKSVLSLTSPLMGSDSGKLALNTQVVLLTRTSPSPRTNRYKQV